MRMLITGAAGMLGPDVAVAARAAGHEAVTLARAELDIRDRGAVQRAVAAAAPEAVVNCAAWTDVDGAESNEDGAVAVNAGGAGNVAAAAAAVGAWTIHVSSDYVFDGRKREPYLESDPVAPQSAYGRSKLEGERAVAEAAPDRHTIVRSSWLFGAAGPCFPRTILRLAGERDRLTVVDDQVGCPTYTGHLAPALVALAARPGGPPPGLAARRRRRATARGFSSPPRSSLRPASPVARSPRSAPPSSRVRLPGRPTACCAASADTTPRRCRTGWRGCPRTWS